MKDIETPELHRDLRIEPVDMLIKRSLCRLGHSLNHKTLPTPLIKLFNAYGGKKTHRYPTQNKNIPNIQKHNAMVFNKNFLCRCLTEYVKLPADVKNEKNDRKFECKLKMHLIRPS